MRGSTVLWTAALYFISIVYTTTCSSVQFTVLCTTLQFTLLNINPLHALLCSLHVLFILQSISQSTPYCTIFSTLWSGPHYFTIYSPLLCTVYCILYSAICCTTLQSTSPPFILHYTTLQSTLIYTPLYSTVCTSLLYPSLLYSTPLYSLYYTLPYNLQSTV